MNYGIGKSISLFATRIINNTGIPVPNKIPAKIKISLVSTAYQKLI